MLVLIVAVAALRSPGLPTTSPANRSPRIPPSPRWTDGTAAVAACRHCAALHAALDDDKDGSVDAVPSWTASPERGAQPSFERVYRRLRCCRTEPADTAAAAAAFGSRKGGGGKGNALDLWRAWRVVRVCSWLSAHGLPWASWWPLARELGIDGPHLPAAHRAQPATPRGPAGAGAQPYGEAEAGRSGQRDLVLFGPPGERTTLKDSDGAVSAGPVWAVPGRCGPAATADRRQRRRCLRSWTASTMPRVRWETLQKSPIPVKLPTSDSADLSNSDELDRAERLRLQDIYQKEIDSLKAEAGAALESAAEHHGNRSAEAFRLAEQEVCQLRAASGNESQATKTRSRCGVTEAVDSCCS
uniref:EF-hand domain-containing protein n=1 Tax=Macrostomum lignano TaxID=282301 RepID=A0A1I8JQW8_9PLAT